MTYYSYIRNCHGKFARSCNFSPVLILQNVDYAHIVPVDSRHELSFVHMLTFSRNVIKMLWRIILRANKKGIAV